MEAGVVEDAHRDVVTAHKEERPPGDGAPPEVSGLRDFGVMPDVQPHPAEDALALQAQHVRRSHRRAMHAEYAVLASILEQSVYLHRLPLAMPYGRLGLYATSVREQPCTFPATVFQLF